MLELYPPTTREARREVTSGPQRRRPGTMLVGFDGAAESFAAIPVVVVPTEDRRA
jgi:hypothetical protein